MSAVQSYLASSGSAVAKRMEEMRQKEARDKESAEAIAVEKLTELRRAVEAASVDWEAETLLAIEKMLASSETGWRGIVMKDIQPLCSLNNTFRKAFLEEDLSVILCLGVIQQGYTEKHIYGDSLVNERARLRIRILTGIFPSLQEQARAEAAIKAAIEAKTKAAEEARLAAEKKAVAAAAYATAMEAQRIKMNAQVNSYLNHPNINTLQHNFTDTGGLPTLFAAYSINRAQPTGVVLSTTPKAFLQVLNVTHYGSVTPAFSEYMTTIQVPETWSHHYELGLLPFLTICPTCGKAPAIRNLGGGNIGHTIDVQCEGHYRWNPDTNQHYKWTRSPPQPAHMVSIQYRPDGYWAAWDPKDPDGVKAAKAVKDKQIAEKEEQIRKLQAELLSLRTL